MASLTNGSRSLIVALCFVVGGAWVTGCGDQSSYTPGEKVGENIRGIAYGRPVPLRQYSQYGAVLGLQVGGGVCTATHLSGRFILTAWHCIGMFIQKNENKNVALAVISPKGPTMIALTPDDYTAHFPAAEKTEKLGLGDGTFIDVPQPDLAIIEITEVTKKATLTALPGADLPEETLKVDEKGLRIAGFGQDSLEAPPQSGRLNSATAQLAEVEDMYYRLAWETGGEFGAGLQGDSGGALHKWIHGKLAVYGVLSNGGVLTTATDATGRPFPLTQMSRYVRLDRKVVRDWVLGVLAK